MRNDGAACSVAPGGLLRRVRHRAPAQYIARAHTEPCHNVKAQARELRCTTTTWSVQSQGAPLGHPNSCSATMPPDAAKPKATKHTSFGPRPRKKHLRGLAVLGRRSGGSSGAAAKQRRCHAAARAVILQHLEAGCTESERRSSTQRRVFARVVPLAPPPLYPCCSSTYSHNTMRTGDVKHMRWCMTVLRSRTAHVTRALLSCCITRCPTLPYSLACSGTIRITCFR
jgi:hypothetical protein